MQEFWDMGGYAAYVWSSYGLAVAVLGANIVWPYMRLRMLRRELQRESSR